MDLKIVSEPKASDRDVMLVKNALYEFNMSAVSDHNPRVINLFVRDDDNVIYGGLLANCWGKWVHIDFLWLSDTIRHRGLGSSLLSAAETEAREFGCMGAYLETFTFQARPFYEKHGYQVVGEVKAYPPGHTYFLMSKVF